MSFNITLTSTLLSTNTSTEFTTELPQPLTIDADTEVALSYIQAPPRLHTVPRNQNRVTVTQNKVETPLEVPVGSYRDVTEVISVLKKLLTPGLEVKYNSGFASTVNQYGQSISSSVNLEPDARID